jgi:hypothetical protein
MYVRKNGGGFLMTINAVYAAKPYSPTKNDVMDAKTFDFLPHGGQDEDENEDGALNNHAPSEFDLENAVRKANAGSVTLQKLSATSDAVIDTPSAGMNTPLTFSFTKINVPPPSFPASVRDLSPDEIESLFVYVSQIVSGLDTSNLTNAEIYRKTESIFKSYFGDDFLEVATLTNGRFVSILGDNRVSSTLMMVGTKFYEALGSHGINADNLARTLKSVNGFTGMSNNEIIAAVRAKYPPVTTLRDVILMSQELYDMGAIDVCVRSFVRGYTAHMEGTEWRNTFPPGSTLPDRPEGNDAKNAFFESKLGFQIDFDKVLQFVQNSAKGQLNVGSLFTFNGDSELAHTQIDEDTANAMKKLIEQKMREMEEYMINALTGSADEHNWLEEAFVPEVIPVNA